MCLTLDVKKKKIKVPLYPLERRRTHGFWAIEMVGIGYGHGYGGGVTRGIGMHTLIV